jgi:hypothetical protein
LFLLLALRTRASDTLISTTVFNYGGLSSQSYTVPAGMTYVVIKAWGAGAGTIYDPSDSWNNGGGLGEFLTADYWVHAGDEFVIDVGGGGAGDTTITSGANYAGGWPGGGNGLVPHHGLSYLGHRRFALWEIEK